MFIKDQLNVFDWFLYYILLAVPVINIIVVLIIMFSGSTNPTLKSMIWSHVLLVVIVVVLFMTVFSGYFVDAQNAFRQVINNFRL